jgi:uncharacterized protein (TIGR00369 family)
MSESTTAPTPADPDYAAAVRTSFARQGLMAELGARLVVVEPGRVEIELPFSPRISQQQGLFHGAAIGAIGDSAGGYAALSLMPAGSEVVTVEYKINFVRPAKGTLLRARGLVLRAGRSMTVARIDVDMIDGAAPAKVALLQATYTRVDAAAT